jgi:hypothetical protein
VRFWVLAATATLRPTLLARLPRDTHALSACTEVGIIGHEPLPHVTT